MIKGYKLVKEIAEKWQINPRTVQTMCSNGKIDGALKIGNTWVIPADAIRPKDGRVKHTNNKGDKKK